MSGRLRLELLGGFHASWENGPPCRLPTRKSEALLAYLALPAGRFHSRDSLATLLWADTGEAQARQSLRQALGSIRRALGERQPSIVLVQADTVTLNPALVTVDAADLEAALADGRMEALEHGVALYKGDLLAGFRVDEAPFEEWRTVERERLNELRLETLAKLLRQQIRAERLEPATQTAMRILAVDPLQEAVHRTLMRLLLRQGRRAAALQQYQTCVACLQRELGVEPEEETRQLYREVLRTPRPTMPRPAAASPLAQAGIPAGSGAPETPVIGREAELEHLRGAVTRMLDDGGRVVLVTGEAGIGKSRLIQELLSEERTRALHLLFGRCHQTEQVLPFRPWIEALRGDGAALETSIRDSLSPGACAQLGTLFSELAGPREAPIPTGPPPTSLFEPLLELLGALASQQPVVLVMEDLHWADTMSVRLLAFLGRRIHRLPALIVGSTRPEELIDAPALAAALKELRDEGLLDEVAPGPLSEADSRALARALQPSPWATRDWDRIVDDIWNVSKGNPFVIVESMRALQQVAPEGSVPPRRMGRRVHELVAVRLDRLAELPRHCVAVAAAIGRDFPFALLARAARLSEREAADAVEELVRRRILASLGDRLDFCHDWIRLVAYDSLLPPRRALLHAAIGEALEELHRDRLNDIADQLGSHYSRAADFGKAIAYLVRFAHLAAQRYALDDAYRALEQAMEAVNHLSPSERDRCRLDVALRQAFVLSASGRQREILPLLEHHAGAAERVADNVLTSEYYFRLGLTHFFLGNRGPALRAAQRSLEHAERIGDPECIGKALHVLSLQAYEIGRPQDGITHATRAIPLLDQPHTQAWLGLVYQDLALNHLVAGDLGAAMVATRQMEALGRTASIPRIVAFAAYVASVIHVLRGATDVAIETARRGLEISRDKIVGGLISGALGHAYLEQGDGPSAISLLTAAADQLQDAPIRHVEIRNTALLAEAYLLSGDAARARQLAERALDLGRAGAMPMNIAVAQRTLGRIARADGDVEAADGYLSEAVELFIGCGAMFEAGRTHLDLAAVRGGRGEKDSAREHLAAALSIFEAAEAPLRVAVVRDLAVRLGVTLAEDCSGLRQPLTR